METKTELRVLNLFEVFAAEGRALSLTELAERIGIAPSSCHALVRGVERGGYLYAQKARGRLYPTRRLYDVARKIMECDVVSPAVREHLARLRDKVGESVCLAKRRDAEVVYLDVNESPQSIRFTVAVGDTRPLHANSMGKAILSCLPAEARAEILAGLSYKKFSERTLTTAAALEADIERGHKRGWFSNQGETVIDALAVAMPVTIGGEWYGVSIVGPHYRMEPRLDAHVKALRSTLKAIDQELARATA